MRESSNQQTGHTLSLNGLSNCTLSNYIKRVKAERESERHPTLLDPNVPQYYFGPLTDLRLKAIALHGNMSPLCIFLLMIK